MQLKVFILLAVGLVPSPSSPLSTANIVDTNVEQLFSLIRVRKNAL